MTTLFWQKRPSKKLIAILLFVIVLATVFVFRRPLVIKSIEHLAKSQNLEISCLDFSLNWRLHLNIEQACITSPLGTVLVRNATWQPWSNVLSIEQVNVKHLATDNNVDKDLPKKNSTNSLNLPDSLPVSVSISHLEIDSFELLQPLYLSVNTTSDNELSITGDLNAVVKMHQNTLDADIVWSLSDLTKWIPQAQKISQDNPQLLKYLALSESKIHTSISFDGKSLRADSRLEIASRFDVSSCPVDVFFNGNILVAVDISSLNTSLDLSQLSSKVSLRNCPLVQDYFAADDVPQLAFIFPQKITIDATQVTLPNLQMVDTQNPLRSIVLNDLNYKTTGELDVSYNITLKQAIQTKQIQSTMLDFQGAGAVSANLSTLHSQQTEQPIELNIINDNNRLVVSNLKIDSLLIANLTSEFSIHHSGAKQIELKGKINSSDIQMGDIKLAKTSSTFSVSGASLDDLQVSIDNQLSRLGLPDVSVKGISNHIDLNIQAFEVLSFSGDSTITNLTAQNIKFLPITVTHTGQANLANMTVSSLHKMVLEQGFMAELEQQQTKAEVRINQQNITSLSGISSQIENELILKQGTLSAKVEFTLPEENQPFVATGKADFQEVFVKYQDYVLDNVSYQTPLTFDSAGLQLAESRLHIDSVDVGITIKQLETNVIVKDSELRLKQVHGEIFSGEFSMGNLWLDGREQQFKINFQDIDLAKLVAVQQQPGIQITGNIDGEMPLFVDKQGVNIEDGRMSSPTGGKLTIVDNPSFNAIKAQQPELALLENFEFSQLNSKVKLDKDGWIFFDFSIEGNNPVKKQAVILNYSHQENIFSLLESIRLVKSVENKIEQKITQGDKK